MNTIFLGFPEFSSVIGVQDFSNNIYGLNAKGQVMMVKPNRQYYTLLEKGKLETVMQNSGFITAKKFSRDEVYSAKVTDVFRFEGVPYSGE